VRGYTVKEIVSDPSRLEATKRFVLDGRAGRCIR